MTRLRKVLHLITLLGVLLVPGTIDAAGPQRGGEPGKKPAGKHAKLDQTLRDALQSGDRTRKRVIIRTKKGSRGSVRYALELYGEEITGEHPSTHRTNSVPVLPEQAAWIAVFQGFFKHAPLRVTSGKLV